MQEVKTFNKILVANRGEIALRVMRSIKEMGIKAIAVYSDIDKEALHVKYADEAYHIGPSPSNQSYLVINNIIKVCKEHHIDAVHPGYGFLSENENFALELEKNGITFIGPPVNAINLMGSKLAAKQFAKTHHIPLVPGTETAITDVDKAMELSAEIGFPILIKASAGGGGKGMRIVNSLLEFKEAMALAQSEAKSAFGDDAVFIEKYVTKPRHIEIQIMADKYGNVVYLFERECSIQRRHQKVIEEAPSVILSEALRTAMGSCAVSIAKNCNYEGAGTVEFLLDDHLNFYFLEMNTRLQVEHPVSEMITGVDLVVEQINVAMGKPLSVTQKDLKINGHSIEIRVYAEDPKNNFLPDIGTLSYYKLPKGNGVRVDDAYEQGQTIPIFYDPMIAKLIVHGKTRQDAISKMTRAIEEYKIIGVETTLDFCKWAINHNAFVSGDFDTNFINQYFTPEILEQEKISKNELLVSVLIANELFQKSTEFINSHNEVEGVSLWKIRH